MSFSTLLVDIILLQRSFHRHHDIFFIASSLCSSYESAVGRGDMLPPRWRSSNGPSFSALQPSRGFIFYVLRNNHSKVLTGIDPDICLPNGLCQNPGDSLYWRESCTGKTWKSKFCLSNLCASSKVVRISDVSLSSG